MVVAGVPALLTSVGIIDGSEHFEEHWKDGDDGVEGYVTDYGSGGEGCAEA